MPFSQGLRPDFKQPIKPLNPTNGQINVQYGGSIHLQPRVRRGRIDNRSLYIFHRQMCHLHTSQGRRGLLSNMLEPFLTGFVGIMNSGEFREQNINRSRE